MVFADSKQEPQDSSEIYTLNWGFRLGAMSITDVSLGRKTSSSVLPVVFDLDIMLNTRSYSFFGPRYLAQHTVVQSSLAKIPCSTLRRIHCSL